MAASVLLFPPRGSELLHRQTSWKAEEVRQVSRAHMILLLYMSTNKKTRPHDAHIKDLNTSKITTFSNDELILK